MLKIKIRDLDTSFDRYTVMITDSCTTYFYAMSLYGDGFNQFCGTLEDGYKDGKHLGKLVDFHSLNAELKRSIKARM